VLRYSSCSEPPARRRVPHHGLPGGTRDITNSHTRDVRYAAQLSLLPISAGEHDQQDRHRRDVLALRRLRANLERVATARLETPVTLLHGAVLLWLLALVALAAMVMAHAPRRTVAEILHDAERP
jgi:hypothetical protein